jgi:hypothetical protein
VLSTPPTPTSPVFHGDTQRVIVLFFTRYALYPIIDE